MTDCDGLCVWRRADGAAYEWMEGLSDSEVVWRTISESQKRGFCTAIFGDFYSSSLASELAKEGYHITTSDGSWWYVKWDQAPLQNENPVT
jgi:hypothetical protein